MADRVRALEDFERSRVVHRVRATRQVLNPTQLTDSDAATDAEVPYVPDDAWPLSRCDQRLTERLGLL